MRRCWQGKCNTCRVRRAGWKFQFRFLDTVSQSVMEKLEGLDILHKTADQFAIHSYFAPRRARTVSISCPEKENLLQLGVAHQAFSATHPSEHHLQ
jgi:hypothetical protein